MSMSMTQKIKGLNQDIISLTTELEDLWRNDLETKSLQFSIEELKKELKRNNLSFSLEKENKHKIEYIYKTDEREGTYDTSMSELQEIIDRLKEEGHQEDEIKIEFNNESRYGDSYHANEEGTLSWIDFYKIIEIEETEEMLHYRLRRILVNHLRSKKSEIEKMIAKKTEEIDILKKAKSLMV
jgi:tRNA G10  N-methylase Trm11